MMGRPFRLSAARLEGRALAAASLPAAPLPAAMVTGLAGLALTPLMLGLGAADPLLALAPALASAHLLADDLSRHGRAGAAAIVSHLAMLGAGAAGALVLTADGGQAIAGGALAFLLAGLPLADRFAGSASLPGAKAAPRKPPPVAEETGTADLAAALGYALRAASAAAERRQVSLETLSPQRAGIAIRAHAGDAGAALLHALDLGIACARPGSAMGLAVEPSAHAVVVGLAVDAAAAGAPEAVAAAAAAAARAGGRFDAAIEKGRPSRVAIRFARADRAGNREGAKA